MPNSDLIIRVLADGEPAPMPLLLLADPHEGKIRAYLAGAIVFVGASDGDVVGVCVLSRASADSCEIKNIAVADNFQNRGLGTRLLRYAIDYACAEGLRVIEIATGNSSVGQLYLYQKVGFEMVGLDKDYFVENYSDPIFEDGIQCKHRIRLSMALQP